MRELTGCGAGDRAQGGAWTAPQGSLPEHITHVPAQSPEGGKGHLDREGGGPWDPDSGSQTKAGLGSPRTDAPPPPGGLGWAWVLLVWGRHFENHCLSLGRGVHIALMSQCPGMSPAVKGPPPPPVDHRGPSGQAAPPQDWLAGWRLWSPRRGGGREHPWTPPHRPHGRGSAWLGARVGRAGPGGVLGRAHLHPCLTTRILFSFFPSLLLPPSSPFLSWKVSGLPLVCSRYR